MNEAYMRIFAGVIVYTLSHISNNMLQTSGHHKLNELVTFGNQSEYQCDFMLITLVEISFQQLKFRKSLWLRDSSCHAYVHLYETLTCLILNILHELTREFCFHFSKRESRLAHTRKAFHCLFQPKLQAKYVEISQCFYVRVKQGKKGKYYGLRIQIYIKLFQR